jgi:PmbA protein
MISDNHKRLAKWALDYCLQQGCQAVRITMYSGSNTDFDVRDKKLDKLQQSTENQLTIYIYVADRFGSFSTNRLEQEEVGQFIEQAVESVCYLAPDPFRRLPDASRYYRGGCPDLRLYDSRLENLEPDEKLQLAHDAADEILGTDGRILSVESNYSDGDSFHYIIDSNGFEGEIANSYFSVSVSVSVKGEGEARPESFWYDQSLTFDRLVKKGIGLIALHRTLQKLGQQKVASGTYRLLVDNLNVGRLLGPVLSALNGGALQQNNSFLLNKLGEQVLSEKVTLLDDPHLPGSFGARYFDNEGVATKKRLVFNKGVLETYFFDTYYALKMGVEPTISGISHLVMELGLRSMKEMIPIIEKGILVTGFNGGNCNSSSGGFSFGIEGFLIENGKLSQPVSEMNITGNMLTLWKNLEEVGNDPMLNNAFQIPSLLFNDVNFSGL